MRWSLALLAACSAPQVVSTAAPRSPGTERGTAGSRPGPPAARVQMPRRGPEKPAAYVPMIMLREPGELFMLAVDSRGVADCERWTVDPARHSLQTSDASGERTIHFTEQGRSLELHHFERRGGATHEASSCREVLPAHQAVDGLIVDRARWFRTAEACSSAISRHDRVATQLSCAFEEPVSERDLDTSRARFEALLQRGGRMYAIADGPQGDHCAPVRFTPWSQYVRKDHLEGDLSYRVEREEAGWIESYAFSLEVGTTDMRLLGPSATYDDGDTSALGCLDALELDYRDGAVRLGELLYFTPQGCQAALTAQVRRRSWLPPEQAGAQWRRLTSVPLTHGC